MKQRYFSLQHVYFNDHIGYKCHNLEDLNKLLNEGWKTVREIESNPTSSFWESHPPFVVTILLEKED